MLVIRAILLKVSQMELNHLLNLARCRRRQARLNHQDNTHLTLIAFPKLPAAFQIGGL